MAPAILKIMSQRSSTSERHRKSLAARVRRTFRPEVSDRLEERVLLTSKTFMVTTTSDFDSHGNPAAGSLRAAMIAANANPGSDSITFKIGLGFKSIALKAALPAITDPVTISGGSQPGYAGKPIIELNGTSAGTGAIGLDIRAGNTVVIGLVINRFGGDGIRLEQKDGNIVLGCYIGLDSSGAAPLGNGGDGVRIVGSSHNSVGLSGSNTRNVISANADDGIGIANILFPITLAKASTANLIDGNFIGTDKSGSFTTVGASTRLGNGGDGIAVNAAGNIIGGNSLGGGNVVSGNGKDGIHIFSAPLVTASGNRVQGNRIGTDTLGNIPLGNSLYGLLIEGAPGNTVGGTTAAARNVISANKLPNLGIAGAGASGNLVEGNYIGTNSGGIFSLGNPAAGVYIFAAPGNIIGGRVTGSGNLISGNSAAGVGIFNTGADGNLVLGNFIGTDVTGTHFIANGIGVAIEDDASNNVIGGSGSGTRNLISGNTGAGVYIAFTGALDSHGNHKPGNVVEGDVIGTDVTGTHLLANGGDGVRIEQSSYNTLGGLFLARNVISGNKGNGVRILGTSSHVAVGNLLINNYIGTNIAGNAALPNQVGVLLDTFADANTIGGPIPPTRNLISGNVSAGIVMDNAGNGENVVEGNYIGTDFIGTGALGNSVGILIRTPGNVIGGNTPGTRNIISGNGVGIILSDPNAQFNQVSGNYIGTDVSGSVAVPNSSTGVLISSAPDNLIGGTIAGSGNVISGNGGGGVRIQVASARGNTVQGNFIGTNSNATSPVPNGSSGIVVTMGASLNLIGGTIPGARNTIAFNNGIGVSIESGTRNGILSNSIYLNTGLGIDLAPLGVTPNDATDSDTGANQLQNFPVLLSAKPTGANTVIMGTLTNTTGSTFLIQFFASPFKDPTGFGEGQTLIGSITVKILAGHFVTFSPSFLVSVPVGQFITATATDITPAASTLPLNNTSEFSNAIAVTP
jgi:hypothetical protein